MFVGLQAYLREYLMRPITLDDIDEAEFVVREQGMHFNRDNWLGILNDHDGFLPVEIEAVPEGTVLPSRNVLVQLINTDPKYFWATSFFETALLRAVWYPSTIGTVSWLSKQVDQGDARAHVGQPSSCSATCCTTTAPAVSAPSSPRRSAGWRTW